MSFLIGNKLIQQSHVYFQDSGASCITRKKPFRLSQFRYVRALPSKEYCQNLLFNFTQSWARGCIRSLRFLKIMHEDAV